jgi:hypothetical protein
MATKYNESNVNRMYTRAHTITLNFPHPSTGLTNSIHFYEQNVIELADGTEVVLPDTVDQADVEAPMEAMGTEFPLWDLLTEEPIEGATATYGQLATLLYSLYFHAAEKRDERRAAETSGEVPFVTEGLDAGMDMPLEPAEPVDG